MIYHWLGRGVDFLRHAYVWYNYRWKFALFLSKHNATVLPPTAVVKKHVQVVQIWLAIPKLSNHGIFIGMNTRRTGDLFGLCDLSHFRKVWNWNLSNVCALRPIIESVVREHIILTVPLCSTMTAPFAMSPCSNFPLQQIRNNPVLVFELMAYSSQWRVHRGN